MQIRSLQLVPGHGVVSVFLIAVFGKSQGKANDHYSAATPPIDGTLCNYYKHAADFCFKLPDHVSLEEGALIEPLSVGIHAARRANITAGDRVIIFGAGPVGLLCAAAAKAAGAGHVTITDLVPSRLEFAKTYCTDSQVLLQRPNPGEPNMDYARRMAAAILETEELADAVIDCTGAETCVQMSVLLSKNGGQVVLVGMGSSIQALPISEISSREVDIKGIFRYCNVSAVMIDEMYAYISHVISCRLMQLLSRCLHLVVWMLNP